MCVCVMKQGRGSAEATSPIEPLIKLCWLQNQFKLGSSVWALSRNQATRTEREGGERERDRQEEMEKDDGGKRNLNLHYFTFTHL